jgi:hypothetical protein
MPHALDVLTRRSSLSVSRSAGLSHERTDESEALSLALLCPPLHSSVSRSTARWRRALPPQGEGCPGAAALVDHAVCSYVPRSEGCVPARSRGPRPGRCESGPALIMCRCRRSARHRRRLSNLSVCVCAKEERAPRFVEQ